jgi:glycosyltransferase involved in cell wall biosynthesis
MWGSVIICAHNPRSNYLERVLDGLRAQTLPLDEWELLLIDNASDQPLAGRFDLSWHPHARHVHEPQLGLAFARQRGMQEAAGSVLVFVDDDNLLAPDYLAEALRITDEWPKLGVWGGSIVPEFEVEPPPRLRKFLGCLALREVKSPIWANVPSCSEAEVWGAGMCVRAEIGRAYRHHFERSKIVITGRRGRSGLASSEDIELCYVACDAGYGMGLFPTLVVTHLIPKERLDQRYIWRLTQAARASNMVVAYKWGAGKPPRQLYVVGICGLIWSILTGAAPECRAYLADIRATFAARKTIRKAAGPRPKRKRSGEVGQISS